MRGAWTDQAATVQAATVLASKTRGNVGDDAGRFSVLTIQSVIGAIIDCNLSAIPPKPEIGKMMVAEGFKPALLSWSSGEPEPGQWYGDKMVELLTPN